jgi:hypothetical protein
MLGNEIYGPLLYVLCVHPSMISQLLHFGENTYDDCQASLCWKAQQDRVGICVNAQLHNEIGGFLRH